LILPFGAASRHIINLKTGFFTKGKVLGTFGTYFREKRRPSPAGIAGIEHLANAAARIVS